MENRKLKKEHLEFFETECEKWMKKFGSDLQGKVKQTALHECLGLLLAIAVLKETRTWKETGTWDESDFKKELHSITRVLEKSLGKEEK